MSKIFAALTLILVLFYCSCENSPTEVTEDPIDSLDIRVTINQYQSEFVELGNYGFNINQAINLQDAAHKEVSFISEAITIHTFLEEHGITGSEIFLVLFNDLDSTYQTFSQQLNMYTTIIANIPNNLNFEGSIYAFLVSDIETQLDDTIFLTIESENQVDTLLIEPAQHTFDLEVSLSVPRDSLNFIGIQNISIRWFNNSENFNGLIENHCINQFTGPSWRLSFLKPGTSSSCSTGGLLSEYFTFYGFQIQNYDRNANEFIDWKVSPMIWETYPFKP